MIKKLFGRNKTLDEYLNEAGLTREDLKDISVTLEFDASRLSDSQKQKLASDNGLQLNKETSNFAGWEFMTNTASAITIISALISLKKWLDSNHFVIMKVNNVKQKVTINQAIALTLGLAKKQTE